ncbi:MAG TPA: DUF502 domain-containing protein [Pseudohongiella sp.]|nr:DUF502 domain-containing protein [Pseudohongiella sp.]
MKKLTRDLLTGLSLLLPVVLSIQLIVWLLTTIESWLKPIWELVLPQSWYLPGMAIVSFLLLALVTGVSFRVRVIGKLWQFSHDLLDRIPILNYIFNTIKDFFDLLGGQDFSQQSVVWVRLPDSPYRLLGVVTKHGADNSKLGTLIKDDEVAVYLPMSYQVGGYMVVVPKANVEPVDMDPGDALRLVMSAGLGQKKKR